MPLGFALRAAKDVVFDDVGVTGARRSGPLFGAVAVCAAPPGAI